MLRPWGAEGWGNPEPMRSLIIALGCASEAPTLLPLTHCRASHRRLAGGSSIADHGPLPRSSPAGSLCPPCYLSLMSGRVSSPSTWTGRAHYDYVGQLVSRPPLAPPPQSEGTVQGIILAMKSVARGSSSERGLCVRLGLGWWLKTGPSMTCTERMCCGHTLPPRHRITPRWRTTGLNPQPSH